MKLTIKQDKFAQKYLECGNASEAYRYAYNAENMKEETIWSNASELLASSKVKARVDELKEEYRKKNEITVEKITKMIEEAYLIAQEKDDATNVRGSAMDMAKLHGLIVEKREIKGEMQLGKKRGAIAERFAKRLMKDDD